jgi:hypothetical protein
MHGVKGVTVKNCTFEHLGLTGVLADAGSQGVNVTDSTFIDTSGSAISIGNVTEAILSPAKQDSDFVIANNFIRDTGAEVHILLNSRYPARTHSHSLIAYRMFG